MRLAIIRIRKRFRQRRWRLLVGLRLVMICLAATALVLVWEGLAEPDNSPPVLAAAPEVVTRVTEKFDDRPQTAIAAEALSQSGGDVSHLPAFELAPPYVSLDGTTLVQGQRKLKLHGVEGPSATQVCLDEQGRRWACGLQARAALHNVLTGGSLSCQPRVALGRGDLTVSCSMRRSSAEKAPQDVARTLVALGWMRPTSLPAPDLEDALASARRERAGLWRGDWALSPVAPPP